MSRLWLAIALAVVGCKREPPKRDLAKVVQDPLAFMPSDAGLIVGIDLVKLRSSELWRDHLEPRLRALPWPITHSSPECDADLLIHIDRIVVGGHSITQPETIVASGADLARKLDCLAPQLIPNDALRVRRREGAILVTDQKNFTLFAAKPATPSTVVVDVGLGVDAVTPSFDASLPLRSPAFVSAFDNIPHDGTIWFVLSTATDDFASVRKKMKATTFAGALIVSDHVELIADMYFDSEEAAAKTTARWMKDEDIGAARFLVDHVELRARGAMMHIEASATFEQLNTLAARSGVDLSL